MGISLCIIFICLIDNSVLCYENLTTTSKAAELTTVIIRIDPDFQVFSLNCTEIEEPVHWLKWNHKQLIFEPWNLAADSQRFTGSPSGSYVTFLDPLLEDLTHYRCMKEAEFREFSLEMKPLILIEPGVASASVSGWQHYEGESVKLTCKTVGTMPITVTWMKGEDVLNVTEFDADFLAGECKVIDGVLAFPAIEKDAEGDYTCRAENRHGSVSFKFWLGVSAKVDVFLPLGLIFAGIAANVLMNLVPKKYLPAKAASDNLTEILGLEDIHLTDYPLITQELSE